MKQADKDALIAQVDAGLVLIGSSSRPSAATINKAEKIFQGVKVACQNIPITPVTDDGDVIPPTTGTEDPPITPDPPEIPPTTGGGGSTGSTPPTTTTVTYTTTGDFTSSQGFRGWSYLEEDGTPMTYDAADSMWKGRELYQWIWLDGQHPGNVNGSMRRWTATAAGTYVISGSTADTGALVAGNGVTVSVRKNGVAIYTRNILNGDSIPTAFTVPESGTSTCILGDTFDFLVASPGDISYDGTAFTASIALTTTTAGSGGSSGTGQTALPFLLNGTAPEDGTVTVNVTKPSNANGATVTVTGVNLTGQMGSYYINGTLASVIWAENPANAGVSASVVRTPDHNLFVNGANTIKFTHTEGTGYTVTNISVAFTVPPPSEPPVTPPSGGAWPNIPSNGTVIMDHAFNVVLGPGMAGGVNGGIQADSSAPLSPPNCALSRLPVGTNSGGAEIYIYHTIFREQFFGCRWRVNPQWTGRLTADKMFFLRGPDSNGFFGLLNGITKGGGNPRFYFGHNSGNVDNSHIMRDELGLTGDSNVGDSSIVPGVWNRIEVQIRSSTTLTSRDGIVRWWVNGLLCGNYTTLNYGPAGLNNWVWTETWDGSGVPIHPVELQHWIDHVYLVGRN